jgi:hypothetical protein
MFSFNVDYYDIKTEALKEHAKSIRLINVNKGKKRER